LILISAKTVRQFLLVFFVWTWYNTYVRAFSQNDKGRKMEMDWMTPLQAAKQWEITERQVQSLCAQGKVKGAIRVSRVWLIPIDTHKPVDGRTKAANQKSAL